MKWGEGQLYAVKGRELRQGVMLRVYKGSGVKVLVKMSMCSMNYCLVYPMVFNLDLTSLGSIRS